MLYKNSIPSMSVPSIIDIKAVLMKLCQKVTQVQFFWDTV